MTCHGRSRASGANPTSFQSPAGVHTQANPTRSQGVRATIDILLGTRWTRVESDIVLGRSPAPWSRILYSPTPHASICLPRWKLRGFLNMPSYLSGPYLNIFQTSMPLASLSSWLSFYYILRIKIKCHLLLETFSHIPRQLQSMLPLCFPRTLHHSNISRL